MRWTPVLGGSAWHPVALLLELSTATEDTVAQSPYTPPQLFERPGAECSWLEGHRDKGHKSLDWCPSRPALRTWLRPWTQAYGEPVSIVMGGQSQQASTCRHSGQSFMEDMGWAADREGSYTKAPNPSSGSSPGRPAPWLFHMHVSHASSLSPASAASSIPGEEGDIRSGMARTEGHWTLP